MSNAGFEDSVLSGAIGEEITWDMLIKSVATREVVDVRDDPFFQSVDVDFLWGKTDRSFVWVESKTDYVAHKTGNIVFEESTSGNVGCFEKTKAKYIAYFVAEAHVMYWIDVDRLRMFVELNRDRLKLIPMGDNAQGYLLSIDVLVKQKIIIGTYKRKE